MNGGKELGVWSWVEARCWVLREQPRMVVLLCARTSSALNRRQPRVRCGRQAAVGGWDRPWLENCTVDASIFVAKFLRAHGGCLGTRSR